MLQREVARRGLSPGVRNADATEDDGKDTSSDMRGEISFLYSSDSEEIEMGDAHFIERNESCSRDGLPRSSGRMNGSQSRRRRKKRRQRTSTNSRNLVLFLPTLVLFFAVYMLVCACFMLPRRLNFAVVGVLAGIPAAINFSVGTLYRVIFPVYIFVGLLLMSG